MDVGQFKSEFDEVADELPDLWQDALDAVQDASLPEATNQDEERLKQVMIRLASVICDLDTAGVDPLVWLEVHDLEEPLCSTEPSRALALIDTAMFLLTDYLDLMRVIDIEGRL